MSFLRELRKLPLSDLLQLFRIYSVKSHDGKSYREGQNPYTFIKAWLAPDPDMYRGDVVQLIREGKRFDLMTAQTNGIFENRIVVLEDFSKYPIRNAFGYDPWDLLQSFISTTDKDRYFAEITGASPENFLNNTERLFYLTRGYGRPNVYMSMHEAELRAMYQNASPTALLALSDILNVCPSQQDPDVVRERLSDIDLRSIDLYHVTAVQEITNSLPDFLKSRGILSDTVYNPITDSYISNITELEKYRNVDPNKTWSITEVQNLPNIFVSMYLESLPDQALLAIGAPRPAETLRSNLLTSAYTYLTSREYQRVGGKITAGRKVDSVRDEFSEPEFLQSIKDHRALIDPSGKVLTPNSAQKLFPELPEISATQEAVLENQDILSRLSPGQRKQLRNAFEDRTFTGANNLILWSRSPDWVPVNITLGQYRERWAPSYLDLVTDTIEYYLLTL